MELPPRPQRLRRRSVAVWSEPVDIPTYPVPPPDRNPLFLEKRVYQGSTGKVYPMAVTDGVADRPKPVEWQAVHLENEYLRVMLLPEIGGRIHVVQDRTTGYDLFYRQNVIKPALVGLLGPWISGGVEFNWPQHHRPTTFMPVDWDIEQLDGGGAVVWCSEHEPMGRMKGMHGVTLRPGSSRLEVQVRLDNRTALKETFLWWANVGVSVHDDYEAFFPPDVDYVLDHARRAVSTFPVARGRYYGVDYGSRPAHDADLRWYRNIPVPTSYMITGTQADFFGGYDHRADEGYVHVADHTASPGKKLWTWGDHEFGYAWDRELTDDDGPYVELMAGVFTDNQPDFSFLLPGETRSFSQAWYPIRSIGPAQAANDEVAVHLSRTGGAIKVGVVTTQRREQVDVRLLATNAILLEERIDIAPDQPFTREFELPKGLAATPVELVIEHDGARLISYRASRRRPGEAPETATEPPSPEDIDSADELYLTGLHLTQYRHATRAADAYFREALLRDPGDSRANTAMGEWHLRRGEFELAATHLRAAIDRLTRRNPNPRDGEAHYLLGVVMRHLGDEDEADEAFGKAAWDGAYGQAARVARAELASSRGDTTAASRSLHEASKTGLPTSAASGLSAALARRSGDAVAARKIALEALSADPFDARAIHEVVLLGKHDRKLPGGASVALDIAHDEARAGLLEEALDAIERGLAGDTDPSAAAMLHYTAAWISDRSGDTAAARRHQRLARRASPQRVFPARLEDIAVLTSAIARDATDPRAPFYLGNLLYDRRRYDEALVMWRRSARLDPSLPTVHRDIGLAEFNVLGRPDRALSAYRRAFRLDPTDARVFYELDQLRKRSRHAPAARLRALSAEPRLVAKRDDLSVEYVTLLNRAGRHDDAIAVLKGRRFHPWEGGEGLVSHQWVVAHRESARHALHAGRADEAVELAERCLLYPRNLGEGKHLLTAENEVQLLLARCLLEAGRDTEAADWLSRAAMAQGDSDAGAGETDFWRALALRASGDDAAATDGFEDLQAAALGLAEAPASIPYFATSLPTMLLFEDDLDTRAGLDAAYLEGLALRGLGRKVQARRRFLKVSDARPHDLEAVLRLDELSRGDRHWPA